MRILFRKMVRDLKEALGQFLSIILVILLGVMIYTGLNATYRDLFLASELFLREYRFADLFCTFSRAPESVLAKIEAFPFVDRVTGRMVQQVKINIQENNADLKIITVPDTRQDIVNDFSITDGKYFHTGVSNECLLEEGFYKAYGMKPGDAIYPVINGRRAKLLVSGSVRGPEFIYPMKDNAEFMPNNRKFGIAYVKESFAKPLFGFNGALNDAGILLKPGVNAKDARDDIKRELETSGLLTVIVRADQGSYAMLDQEIKGLKAMGNVTPIVFFIVAAVILYIMMGRIVENQRVQIGVLKALGYTNGQVLAHYLSYSVFIGLAGSLTGTVTGMFLGKFFTTWENEFFNLPLSGMRIYPELALPASALTLAFCLLAGFRACRTVLRIMPGEAMRQKAPAAGRRIFLEGMTGLWRRLGYDWKMIFRNIFRYKRRALLTSVGIVFCVAILLLTFCLNDSTNYMIDQQFRNMQNYDIKVTLTRFVNKSGIRDIRSIPHVVSAEPVLETGVELSKGWVKKSVGYTALDDDPKIYRVLDEKGGLVKLDSDGIMIPEKLAKTLDVKPGDRIGLKPLIPGRKEKETLVKGIIAQYLGTSAYSTMEGTSALFGEGEVMNAAVLVVDPPYLEEVMKKLEEMPFVNSVQSGKDALASLLENMGVITAMVGFIIVLAAVLSVAVIYNITTINIFERKKELATMKVLGFTDAEVRKLVFCENYLITGFAILLGLPAGYFLCGWLIGFYQTDFYSFPLKLNPGSYLSVVGLTVLFTAFANRILRRKICKIEMVSVLKSNE